MSVRKLGGLVLLAGATAALATAAASAHLMSGSHTAGLPNTCSKPVGKGKYVIASDFPLQGSLRPLSVQMSQAVKFELQKMHFKIGKYTVQYVSCDDSTAAKGSWDPQTCTNNANSYRSVSNLLGVIGTYNSGCAEIIAPILNRAPGGGIPMVSPANTYVGLTKADGVAGEPQKYFPTGKRNYARVAVPDNFQGAADAVYLKQKKIKTVYVLNDAEAYGLGIANNFVRAAKKLGIKVLGNSKWDPNQPNYQSLYQGIASKHPQAIFLGGIVSNNGGQLIKDKVSVLGNNSKVLLLATDGFNDSATAKDAGSAANGMYVTIGGSDPNKLSNASGRAFVKAFRKAYHVKQLEAYTAYAAQATLVLANALVKGNGTRASTDQHLFNQKFPKGIIGSFKIDSSGDPTLAGVTVDVIKGGVIKAVTEINPPIALAKAALG
ncbi:MAG TPA: branched-chain amino acid ABC transporter substrate-binding protein [Gaiellaceae bacterium]|nr:branched-chain amino acid ABC transporter substrate-binding protein [Gaiellaceae bacterium]